MHHRHVENIHGLLKANDKKLIIIFCSADACFIILKIININITEKIKMRELKPIVSMLINRTDKINFSMKLTMVKLKGVVFNCFKN